MIFNQRSEQEKLIKKVEHELLKLKRKRDFLQPRVKTTFFFKKEVEEVVPVSQYEEVKKITSKIIELEDKLVVLKKDQKEGCKMKDVNIVRSGIGMSQKTITPFIENSAEIIVDSKGDFNRKELEAKGYKVADLDKCSSFDPYKALKELAEEDPAKFEKVVKQLKSIIKKDQ